MPKTAKLTTLKTINQQGVAEVFGVTVATIRRWVKEGHLPPPHLTMGRCKIWNHVQLISWIARRAAKNARAAELRPDPVTPTTPAPNLEAIHPAVGAIARHP